MLPSLPRHVLSVGSLPKRLLLVSAAALLVLTTACGGSPDDEAPGNGASQDPGVSDEPAPYSPNRAAGSGNVAAVLVVHGDGGTTSVCVPLPAGEEVDGLALLELSDLDVASQYFSEQGGSVICGLDGEGCDFPDQSCFCSSGNHWAYWLLGEDGWVSAGQGPAKVRVGPGEVQAWRWGGEGEPPPPTSFCGLCPCAEEEGTEETGAEETGAETAPTS